MQSAKLAIGLIAVAIIATPKLACAADLQRPAPVYKAPPPAPPPPFSWTGFYLGGNIGGAWAQGSVTDNYGMTFSGETNGVFIGGGQVGANYQFPTTNVVIGIEGDFDWAANNNHTSSVILPGVGLGHTFTGGLNDRWLTTLTGRLGWSYDRVLFYGKGGGAWVGDNGFTVTDVTTGTTLNGSMSNNITGWVAGGGIEWAFANNWTAKVEYNYIGLPSRTFTVPFGSPLLGGDTFTTGNRNNIQTVTVGINYLFNWWSSPGPVAARY